MSTPAVNVSQPRLLSINVRCSQGIVWHKNGTFIFKRKIPYSTVNLVNFGPTMHFKIRQYANNQVAYKWSSKTGHKSKVGLNSQFNCISIRGCWGYNRGCCPILSAQITCFVCFSSSSFFLFSASSLSLFSFSSHSLFILSWMGQSKHKIQIVLWKESKLYTYLNSGWCILT